MVLSILIHFDRPLFCLSLQQKKIFGYNSWQWLFFLISCGQLILLVTLTSLNLKSLIDLNKFTSSSFVINVTILIICGTGSVWDTCPLFWSTINHFTP